MNDKPKNDEIVPVAEKVKLECINAALEAFTSASEDGLCCEGAWECAVEAMRNLNTLEIINRYNSKKDV
jgi:hypothetical protein